MTVPFSKAIKRAALLRSGKQCEAIGPMYGLPEGKRCCAPLDRGFDFDHIILWANSRDSTLENCATVCRQCHKHKSANHDTPLAAKTLRQQDKASGIKKPSTFPKPPPGYDPWKRRMKEAT
jgi:5-methylcytosine-specific restriction endonuclease McrA